MYCGVVRDVPFWYEGEGIGRLDMTDGQVV